MRRMKAEKNDKGCADGRRQGRGRTAKSCTKKREKKVVQQQKDGEKVTKEMLYNSNQSISVLF